MYLEKTSLYFVPKFGEFFKIQPSTGDNLSADDVAAGYTDYIIWNRFRTGELDIDGELDMECVDSGMLAYAGFSFLRQKKSHLSVVFVF